VSHVTLLGRAPANNTPANKTVRDGTVCDDQGEPDVLTSTHPRRGSQRDPRLMARYLVTGGAGFVGSHVALALLDRGHEVVVLDNLSQGHRGAVPAGARLVEGDLADAALVDALLADGPWDGVLHFAALSLVGESLRRPFRYLLGEVGHGIGLIDACARHRVRRFVLSSTADLFATAHDGGPVDEDSPLDPGSPYGESMLMLERALRWAVACCGLRGASLRYANAAGADPQGRAGEDRRLETHLIPTAIDAAMGRRPAIAVFGTDYPTPDGTCVRDYVHVSDLADAHLRALDALDRERSVTYVVGTGQGHSVLDVIHAVARTARRTVQFRLAERRPGDRAALVAASARIRRETGWSPRFTALDDIVRTAWRWREDHPFGYGGRPSSAAAAPVAAPVVAMIRPAAGYRAMQPVAAPWPRARPAPQR
jgi:UDP-glucose 4-epimerase